MLGEPLLLSGSKSSLDGLGASHSMVLDTAGMQGHAKGLYSFIEGGKMVFPEYNVRSDSLDSFDHDVRHW